ncbi:MAG: hypothetical protein MI739_07610 [Bacteroidales bacterium]|nr:hypothetical protein [Bacteroidales bacterium]
MKKFKLTQTLLFILSFTVLFCSCDNEDDIIEKILGAYSKGVFITNEGAFGAGNGSISFYNYEQDSVLNNIFEAVNNRVLGDVVQSLTVHNNAAYIVVNASNKIEVASSITFTEKGVVNNVKNPRYFLGITNSKAYVSQWGDNGAIKVINLESLQVTKTISVGKGAEKMLLHNNKVYVANSGGLENNNTVSVINAQTDEVIKTITLEGDVPRDIVIDINNKIWVLCSGYVSYNQDFSIASQTPSKLVRINPTQNTIEETINIGNSYHPTSLEISKDGNYLFYGAGAMGLYKMNINDNTAPSTPLINKYFYGFDLNKKTGNIFASEAKFTSSSTLYRYDADGILLGTYKTGIGCNGASSF